MNANPLELFWEGYQIDSYDLLDDQSLLIRLIPGANSDPGCGRCGRICDQLHDWSRRRLRERDLFAYRVWLEVPVRRVLCPSCGPSVESISWLIPRQRLTRSMVNWVETLVRLMPVAHVAQLLGLNWHTVKEIDMRRLKREVKEPDRREIRRLIMDELLAANQSLLTVYLLKDQLRELWYAPSPFEARRRWRDWYRMAYGFRDNEYFFLKIRAAFPGKMR